MTFDNLRDAFGWAWGWDAVGQAQSRLRLNSSTKAAQHTGSEQTGRFRVEEERAVSLATQNGRGTSRSDLPL